MEYYCGFQDAMTHQCLPTRISFFSWINKVFLLTLLLKLFQRSLQYLFCRHCRSRCGSWVGASICNAGSPWYFQSNAIDMVYQMLAIVYYPHLCWMGGGRVVSINTTLKSIPVGLRSNKYFSNTIKKTWNILFFITFPLLYQYIKLFLESALCVLQCQQGMQAQHY